VVKPSVSVSVDYNVAIPMRDGVTLYGDLYRPAGGGRHPVVLERTAYDKSTHAPFGVRAARAGYALLIQDIRGRWQSEGEFHAFKYEQEDGYDTCDWICAQPWSTGRIGMYGGSYVGATQWQAALAGAPGLQAIVPNVTAADYHEGWCYQGGAFELQFLLSWTLTWLASNVASRRADADPTYRAKLETLYDRIDAMDRDFDRMPLAGDPLLAELAPFYDEWLAHPDHGPFWDRIKVAGNYDTFDIAALHTGAWYDVFLGGTLENYVGMRAGAKTERARQSQGLLIGPWEHMTIVTQTQPGDYNPGVRSWYGTIDYDGILLRWYDRHLRDLDNGLDGEPPVRIFVMGENRWRHEAEWPLARTDYQDWYFGSGGRANTLNGDGTLSREEPSGDRTTPDAYVYNPLDPVPTVGGGLCCNMEWSRAGAFDQRAVEVRPDVLCYTSEPLERPLEVTGPIRVILHASSSAVDTDFTAKLIDVCPCGCVMNLTDGIIRARYRSSTRQQELLTPGELVQYEIDLWATSNLFKAGHQLRVEISSSNFPRFDRNTNTGGVQATATKDDCLPALQRIFHDAEHPSRIVLPVVE
jgi:putative CocE/NonD family hydrolase